MSSEKGTGGAPAQILATEEGNVIPSLSHPGGDVSSELDAWDGVLKCKAGPGSVHSDWEVVGPANVSLCGSSPRSLSAEDMEVLKPEELGHKNTSMDECIEGDAFKPNEELQKSGIEHHCWGGYHQIEEVMESRPPSPYSVEGSLESSSYTRVTPPESPSYVFSPEAAEAPDSDWESDNEGDGSGPHGTQSETDSEEALRDLEALSQEGSLDGLSDTDAQLDDPISVPSIRYLRFSGLGTGWAVEGAEEGLYSPLAGLPMSIAGSFHTVVSITSDTAPVDMAADVQSVKSVGTAVVPSGTSEDVDSSVAADVPPAAMDKADPDPTEGSGGEEEEEKGEEEGVPSSKEGDAKTPGGGLIGLPVKKVVEGKPGYIKTAMRSIWEWFKLAGPQGWAAVLHATFPKFLPGGCALAHRVDLLRSCLSRYGWPMVATGAAASVIGLLAFVIVQNRQLARALRSKDDEMTRLIVKVFSLQEKLAVSRRIPILRHTSHTQKCSFGTFASASTVLL